MEHDTPLAVPRWSMVVATLALGIRRYRLPIGNEVRLHESLAQVFGELTPDVAWQREHRFDASDRVDFFAPACGVAIEVKVAGSLPAVAGQLLRYAEHAEVVHLVLVTGRGALLPLARAWHHTRVHLTVIPLIEGQL